jgi:hypothetical protein
LYPSRPVEPHLGSCAPPGRIGWYRPSPVVSPPANFRCPSGTDAAAVICKLLCLRNVQIPGDGSRPVASNLIKYLSLEVPWCHWVDRTGLIGPSAQVSEHFATALRSAARDTMTRPALLGAMLLASIRTGESLTKCRAHIVVYSLDILSTESRNYRKPDVDKKLNPHLSRFLARRPEMQNNRTTSCPGR